MSAENEAVVRRFYEEMNNGRKNEVAGELFTADHTMHDPQVPADDGPEGMVAVVSTYRPASTAIGRSTTSFLPTTRWWCVGPALASTSPS